MRLRGMLLLLACASTCTPNALQVQARLANSVALAGNRALDALVATYRADGLRVIEEARASGADRAEAERRLAAHRTAWRGVWGECDDDTGQCSGGAWPAVRATHAAWSEALESQIAGEPLNLERVTRHATQMHAAYCALRGALPATSRESVPQIPGAPCP